MAKAKTTTKSAAKTMSKLIFGPYYSVDIFAMSRFVQNPNWELRLPKSL